MNGLQKQRRGNQAPPRGQRGIIETVPSPVGGWNDRDEIDDMEPNEAVELVNLFPGQGQVSLRNGFSSHSTGMGGFVETIAEFNAGGTRKMISGANGNLWDSTSASSASSLASGYASNRWQWSQFDDSSGGARIGFVNGSDAPQIYNGSAVSAMTISGSGLTPSNLNGIHIHKFRSYFWDSRTQDFWYSAANALGGALTKFPLGRVAGTGGNLTAVGTWTKDGGDGQDDLACFFLSSGDVVIYAGDNPGDSAAWALVGIFKIGAPLGPRAVHKLGADLAVSTIDGYQSLSLVIGKDRTNASIGMLSDKIRKAVLYATKNYQGNYGWQISLYPLGNMGIFNVPVSASNYEQHIINTQTGAWCKFSGIDARCWGMFNDRMYLGGAGGVVYKFDTGRMDGAGPINARGQTAWNYFNKRSQNKKFTGVCPILRVDGALTYSVGVGCDFKPISTVNADSSVQAITSPWDTSPWDTSPWSDEVAISDAWIGADGTGYNVSARLAITTSTRAVDWLATRFLYEPGRGAFG